MLVHFGAEELSPEWEGAVVCIGTFDGIHKGHAQVIRSAVDLARHRETASVVITFDRHPAAVLAPERAPEPIYSLGQNLRRIAELGPTAAVVLPFDRELADCSAEQFFQTILIQSLRAEAMVIGHDFAFGHNRQGTGEWLETRITTQILSPVVDHAMRVSSTEIRNLITSGSMVEAAQLLGSPFEIEGAVVRGEKLGRTIGFPTANLARITHQITPPNGVYAGRIQTPQGQFAAAVGIGVRPTVGGASRTIEAYLLDYPGDALYGHTMRLELLDRIRDEVKFESLEALARQMESDVDAVRRSVTTAGSDLP